MKTKFKLWLKNASNVMYWKNESVKLQAFGYFPVLNLKFLFVAAAGDSEESVWLMTHSSIGVESRKYS